MKVVYFTGFHLCYLLQCGFMRVAIQGQAGSYHHQAATTFFDKDIEIVGCDTFKDTFAALASDKADYAVIAIENSLFGSINQTYDLLLKNKFWVCGEVYLRIEHCLIGLPGSSIAGLKEVHSQLEALAQCEDYLDSTLSHVARLEHHDTAASVAHIKKLADPSQAAIASEQAAKLHGMQILQKGIEDNKENYTRFIGVQKQKQPVANASKTSLVITTGADTKAGALYKALGVFAERDINLSMLQSRPLVGKAWHYLFYVDLDIGEQEEGFTNSLNQLAKLGFEVQILGSYQGKRDTIGA